MKRIVLTVLPFVVALPLVVAAAVWQGRETERWGEFPELKVYAARLADMPLVIGPWKGQIGPRLDEETRRYVGAVGDIQVSYINQETGERANVFIVCGRLYDVLKHRPDRCYPAHGYQTEEEERPYEESTADKRPVGFRTAVYVKEDKPTGTRIYWSWSSDGNWKGPDDIRTAFQRSKPIFKLYVDHDVPAAGQPLGEGPSPKFIRVLIPALNKALFPKDAAAKPAGDA